MTPLSGRRLILMRHGKAEARAASGEDCDRDLTERGRRDVRLVADALARADVRPDLALVSPAARARATWEAVAPAFPGARAQLDRTLYDADESALMEAASSAAAGAPTLMIVAHNPGLHGLAHRLGRGGPLNEGLPTGAAAVIAFDRHGRSSLALFIRPSDVGGGREP